MAGSNGAGKGDKPRPYDKAAWDRGWDRVFKSKLKKPNRTNRRRKHDK